MKNYEITDIIKNPIIYDNINKEIYTVFDEYKAHMFYDREVKYEILTYLRKTDKILIIGQGAVGKEIKTNSLYIKDGVGVKK